MSRFLYLVLDLAIIVFPLLWSFEKKMFFYSKWKPVFKAILFTSLFFLAWDMFFTYLGVWGFNPLYVVGINIINLPIEEVLFFVVVPFSSLFIYESCRFLMPAKIKQGIMYQASLVMCLILFFVGIYFWHKYYTCFAFVGGSLILFFNCIMKKQISHEAFWIAFVLLLIPFCLVNGILTGYFTSEPIVWYNDYENLDIRFFTIPVEDFAYSFVLFLVNVTLYEWFLKREYSF